MLTPASTASTPFTYETAQKDFAHSSREVQEIDFIEIMIITQRNGKALPAGIPPLLEKQLKQATSIIPLDEPTFRC